MRLLRWYFQGVNYIAFLDGDNVSDVDWLSDVVWSDTENLVVVFSKDILMRPWRVGEIVVRL